MASKTPVGAVDPKEHLYKPLWVVYGGPSYPKMRVVCLNEIHGYGINLWGYSVYKRSPGYRTDGVALCVWIERNSDGGEPVFFDYHANAIEHMRVLTTPKCEPLTRR